MYTGDGKVSYSAKKVDKKCPSNGTEWRGKRIFSLPHSGVQKDHLNEKVFGQREIRGSKMSIIVIEINGNMESFMAFVYSAMD